MMPKLFLSLSAAVGVAALGLSAPVAPPPHEPKGSGAQPRAITITRDILYATHGPDKLELDLAKPTTGGPFPCVVLLHGGAWKTGHRRDLSIGSRDGQGTPTPSVMEQFAQQGYVAAAVSYRLAPKHRFPAQIQDARAAVRYLRANAQKWNIDREKFAAVGFSAGGHLALLLGLADRVDGWDVGENLQESSRVQCVVDFFGPTDLSLYANSPGLEDSYMVPVFGPECKKDPKIYQTASPLNYVTAKAPPVLIFHGTFDLIVPIVHSENLLKKLHHVQATAQLIPLRGAGHGWNGKTLTRTIHDSLKFLDTHLKVTP
ncbi:MAG: alpha/beta hydrolase [Gemmataceae bacterium]|nr:alpha/beta hydrolase [Gemmata sp.]MDW8197799.1 alpha/beta hydrolase [Gemmataceae bacterium]